MFPCGASSYGVLLSLLLALLSWVPAQAQLQNGRIQGQVLAAETGLPVGGATVVLSGPAMQRDQIEVADVSGHYLITNIPPGDDYQLRFFYNDVAIEQPQIHVVHGKTLTVSVKLPRQPAAKPYVVQERAPNVDTASSVLRTEIGDEELRNLPLRSRTFESVLGLAPGAVGIAPALAQGGDAGITFGGSTGAENSYLVDGLNTTDPSLGLVGTPVHPYFIKELNILAGGYQAEYGRSTGGLASIVTKSGSNTFHGGVFFSWVPLQLDPEAIERYGEAITRKRRENLDLDFGFDLGGPIIHDRLWFYIGVAPTFTEFPTERGIRVQTPDPQNPGHALPDPNFRCPQYLSWDGLCDGPRQLALRSSEIRSTRVTEYQRRYNVIAKLQLNLAQGHDLSLGYLGVPETFDGYRRIRADYLGSQFSSLRQVHDVTARYSGNLLNGHLQIELTYGYHRQTFDEQPTRPDKPAIWYRASPGDAWSLADFEDVPECRRTESGFNPCPITSYTRNGYSGYSQQTVDRHAALAAATVFFNLFGRHALKVGFDFEGNLSDTFNAWTGRDHDPADPLAGHRLYQTDAEGRGLKWQNQVAQQDPNGGLPIQLDGFRAQTASHNYALYIRDSYSVSFAPGLVLNLGLRWEAQELFGADGSKRLAIYDNMAPRLGLVYDFTRRGRSRLYFNYGRYYESVPLAVTQRRFVNAGSLSSEYADDCLRVAMQPGGRPLPVPEADASHPCNFPAGMFSSSSYTLVAPRIQGQFINEIVLGAEYEVGLGIVLGVSYVHRDLGNIIEDMSIDAGQSYIIGNPGALPEAGALVLLQAEAERLSMLLQQGPASPELKIQAQRATGLLHSYQYAGTIFPRAQRDYNALTVTASKRLSTRFSLLGSYTFSRTIGNYPGLFTAANNNLDPNISTQYDFIDLLANRKGPLQTDRPHNFKLAGTYRQPILATPQHSTLTGGLTFTVYSGSPIEVLGYHPAYAELEVFILPRGSGGRLPAVTQLDLHLGYEKKLSGTAQLSLSLDVINVLNLRQVISVDPEYTGSPVAAILNGTPEDLRHLRALDGGSVVINSNYGHPTNWQAPLFLRVGARLSF